MLGVLVEGRVGALDLGLDPALLLGVLDVHVLDADRAAVGVAQHAEQVAERHLLGAGDAAGEELAVEVPDRQPVRQRVELLGHRRLLPAQRVEVGDEVAADAVDADQRGDLHLLLQHRLFAVDRVDVGPPAHRLVRHVERRRTRRRRSSCSPSSSSCTRFRNMPLSAPWMMRWSYVLVIVTTLLMPSELRLARSAPSNSAG